MTLIVDALLGGGYIHANGDRGHAVPANVRWDRVSLYELETYYARQRPDAPVWFTDGCMPDKRYTQKQVGLLMEPPQLHPENYMQAARALYDGYLDILYTHHHMNPWFDDVHRLSGKVRPYPHGGTRIHESDWLIWGKHVLTPSIVASPKRSLPGHALRHEVIDEYFGYLHRYGPEYTPIASKLEALQQYHYSIAIENVNTGVWFTEALLDCFLTGTVPIWWGNPEALIKWGFDAAGMLAFKTVANFKTLLPMLTRSRYEDMLPAIERNFIKAHEYTTPEDWLWRRDQSLFA